MDPNRLYGFFPQIPDTTTEAPEVSSQMLTETLPAPDTVLVPKVIINVSSLMLSFTDKV